MYHGRYHSKSDSYHSIEQYLQAIRQEVLELMLLYIRIRNLNTPKQLCIKYQIYNARHSFRCVCIRV